MENRRQDPTLLWQVFGSATGVTRYYPGGHQPISPVHSAPHAPPPPWPLILGAWEGMVTLSIAGWPGPLLQGLLPGPGTSLPAPPSHLLSSRSYAVASPQENRPVRCPKETLVSEQGGVGQGHPPQLAFPLPSLPVPRPPSRAQPALSNFHFTHRCHWKMDPITQAGLPAASALIHCPALHPLGTEGLGPWGFPRGVCPLQGWPASAVLHRSPRHPYPLPASPAILHGLVPCHLFNPLRSYDSLPSVPQPGPAEMTSH